MRVSYMSPLNTKSRWMKPSFWAASRVISIATPPQTVVIHHPGLVFCVSRVHCQQPTTSYQPQPPTQTTTGNPTRKMIERSLNNGAAALTVLFTDDGSDGWYGKWEPFLKKKKQPWQSHRAKKQLIPPGRKNWDPLAPLQKKPLRILLLWWEWQVRMMRMMHEATTLLTNLWFTLGERNENKNKGGCHHKKNDEHRPRQGDVEMWKIHALGDTKGQPCSCSPLKVGLPFKDSSIPNINFQGRTGELLVPGGGVIFLLHCILWCLPLSKVCPKTYQAYAGFTHVCIPELT